MSNKLHLLLLIGLTFVGCDNNRYDYDNGYEAAWNDEDEPTWFSNEKYCQGFQQGQEDAALYDDGFYDGCKNKRAKYPHDLDYMDGFRDGHKSKRY